MRVLITGGTGFIGGHLIERLTQISHELISLSRKGPNITASEESAQRTRAITGDLLKPESLKTLSHLNSIDVLYHLAGANEGEAEDLIRTNFIGTFNLLRSLENTSIGKIVFTSTYAVYGETGEEPVGEDHPPKPKTPYGLSKLCAEHYCRMWSENHGVKMISLRLSSVYGPRKRAGVVYKYLQNALNHQPLVVYGSGKQTRDFVYIDDAVGALLLCLNYAPPETQIFNISSGRPIAMLDLISIIETVIGKRIAVEFRSPPSTEVLTLTSNPERARRLLGFNPKVSLKQGIARTAEYLKSRD